MKYAIDFGILKRNEFIIDGKKKQIKNLNLKKRDIVLTEIGCPKGKLYQYAEKCKVFLIDGKETDKARKGKKTHKEDALTILKLYKQKPELFKELTIKDKEELERIKQFKIYMRVTKTLAGIKNIQKAQQREYGEELENIKQQIKLLEKEKKELLKPLEVWVKPYLEQVEDIKGLGPRYLIEILLFANPEKFPCLSAYLKYCGYKGSAYWKIDENGKKKKHGKYHHGVHAAYYCVVDGIIKHRNHGKDKGETITGIKTTLRLNSPLSFGQMYDEFKKNIAEKNKDWTKGKINGVTINRIATFVAKDIYKRFH